VRFPRCRPAPVWAVDAEGGRARVVAHELVLERPVGPDLEVNLAPHPIHRGSISLGTFRGTRALLLEPAAGNVLYVYLDAWPPGDPRRKRTRRGARTPLCHVYAVNARGEKRAISARRFAVELAGGELEIDFTPPAPWAQHVLVRSERAGIVVRLGAANIVGVSLFR
jgi:hypothetical protein